MASSVSEEHLVSILQGRFLQRGFRSSQLDIVKSVLRGEDVLVVLPTGHGKSLTYQLPAVAENQANGSRGFYIVISPLLALMKDQVAQLKNLGISAESINSTTSPKDRLNLLDDFAYGDGCLLYVSPEQCFTSGFRSYLEQLPPGIVKRVVIDEAHCAVEWGSDFRRDYARLGSEFREALPNAVPIMALTGTASPRMQQQIIQTLKLNKSRIFAGSTLRPHLHYEVRYIEDTGDRLVDLLRFIKSYRRRISALAATARTSSTSSSYPGCGLIYCRSRASTELIARECNKELGQCAAAYHAGLSNSDRTYVMENWIRGDPHHSVVVATVAFGLGIDKPDTRFVVHFDLPQNMEAYVQQTGRAGRDRKAARCILYYSAQDSHRCQRFVKDKNSAGATIALLKYATTICKCRHQLLMEYFTETGKPGDCKFACDFCKMPQRLRQRYENWYSEFS